MIWARLSEARASMMPSKLPPGKVIALLALKAGDVTASVKLATPPVMKVLPIWMAPLVAALQSMPSFTRRRPRHAGDPHLQHHLHRLADLQVVDDIATGRDQLGLVDDLVGFVRGLHGAAHDHAARLTLGLHATARGRKLRLAGKPVGGVVRGSDRNGVLSDHVAIAIGRRHCRGAEALGEYEQRGRAGRPHLHDIRVGGEDAGGRVRQRHDLAGALGEADTGKERPRRRRYRPRRGLRHHRRVLLRRRQPRPARQGGGQQ